MDAGRGRRPLVGRSVDFWAMVEGDEKKKKEKKKEPWEVIWGVLTSQHHLKPTIFSTTSPSLHWPRPIERLEQFVQCPSGLLERGPLEQRLVSFPKLSSEIYV